jgi:integrase
VELLFCLFVSLNWEDRDMQKAPSVSLFRPRYRKNDKTCIVNIWWMKWRENGKVKTESTGTANRREALRRAQKRQLELERGDAIRDISWADAVSESIKMIGKIRRPTTATAYCMSLEVFGKLVSPTRLESVDKTKLANFAELRKKSVAVDTMEKDLRACRRFLRWAEDSHYLRNAPSFKGFIHKGARRKMPVVVSREKYDAMIAAVEAGKVKLTHCSAPWFLVFLRLAYGLGLRRGELLSARWLQVDFDDATFTVLTLAEREELDWDIEDDKIPKGHESRVLPLDDELLGMLRGWRDQNPGEEAILPFAGPVRSLYEDWHKIAGADVTPKHFRSSCATQMAEAGVPALILKEWLGHSSVTTTERYYVNLKRVSVLRGAAEARKAIKLG